MSKFSLIVIVAAMMAALLFSGCKKQGAISVIPADTVVNLPVDTAVTVVETPYDTTDNVEFSEAKLDDDLAVLVAEKLKPVYFEYNSFSLTQESMDALAAAGTFLKAHPAMRVLVEGHCDDRGSSEYNMGLGESRAKTVREYLSNYGLPASRIETSTWGKERLVSPACSDDPCHAKNRRAEFKVLSK